MASSSDWGCARLCRGPAMGANVLHVARISEAHPGMPSAAWCHGGPGCGLRPYTGYAEPGGVAPDCVYVARVSEAHPGMEAQRRLVPRQPRMRPAALSGLRRTCGSGRLSAYT